MEKYIHTCIHTYISNIFRTYMFRVLGFRVGNLRQSEPETYTAQVNLDRRKTVIFDYAAHKWGMWVTGPPRRTVVVVSYTPQPVQGERELQQASIQKLD